MIDKIINGVQSMATALTTTVNKNEFFRIERSEYFIILERC